MINNFVPVLGDSALILPEECAPGWVEAPGLSTCYKFVANPKKSWASAQTECGKTNSAYLVNVNNATERDWLKNWRINNGAHQDTWFGGLKFFGSG